MIQNPKNNHIRNGCVDMWNAFMVQGADFVLESDIPVCPCTANAIPKILCRCKTSA